MTPDERAARYGTTKAMRDAATEKVKLAQGETMPLDVVPTGRGGTARRLLSTYRNQVIGTGLMAAGGMLKAWGASGGFRTAPLGGARPLM